MWSIENILKYFLRTVGSVSLMAIVFVAAPYSWMDSIHQSIGLGTLPDNPVVGYLARATSAFYAFLGGLLWFISFDLKRYAPLFIYLGGAIVLFGVAMTIVDWAEGLPLFWKWMEGPADLMIGIILIVAGIKIRRQKLKTDSFPGEV